MNFRNPIYLPILAAIVLVLIGLYIVEQRRAVSPSGTGGTWQSDAAYIDTPVSVAIPSESEPEPVLTDTSGEVSLVIPKASTTPPKQAALPADGTFDYNTLLAQMRRSASQVNPSAQAQSTYEELMGAFDFSPTIAAPVPKVKTAEQQAQFAYGNLLGSRLRAFVAVNTHMTDTLTAQINDRASQSKGNAVRDLGLRYRTLGEGILSMENVPGSFAAAHKKLGESYVQLGEALSAVPNASDDQAYLAAITAYNGKADAYTNAFVSIVSLFIAHDVVFEETDAGSVFSFRR